MKGAEALAQATNAMQAVQNVETPPSPAVRIILTSPSKLSGQQIKRSTRRSLILFLTNCIMACLLHRTTGWEQLTLFLLSRCYFSPTENSSFAIDRSWPCNCLLVWRYLSCQLAC